VLIPAAALALLLGAVPAAGSWEDLEARGEHIQAIEVVVQDVFDRSDPKEDTFLGRLADRVHVDTRERVVRGALLFKVGDPVNARRVRETERLLRAMLFFKDARIDPEPLPGGGVLARVLVRDAWTLKFSIHYKLLGGQSTRGFALQEQNLLGTGKTLVFNWVQDPVRSTETFGYKDSQVLGSTWTLQTAYANLSDGSSRMVAVQRPFLSLDTPWSATFQASEVESAYGLSDRGATVYSAHSRVDKSQLGAAWAVLRGERSVLRTGPMFLDQEARYGALVLDADPGGLPAPDLATRVLRGPGWTLGYLEDGYGIWRDLAGMDATEDYNVGWSWDLTAGSYLPAWGATAAAPYFQADLAKGWSSGESDLLLLQGLASGRREPGGWKDVLAELTATGYWKESPHQITAAWLELARAQGADPEDIYYLGANEGLRGFGNYLHPGDARWLCSLEQRTLTEVRWLGILRLGFVTFADVGAIHRLDGAGWTSPYPDVGAGLRLGDLKSSLGRVILITAAFPLTGTEGIHGWQLEIGNITRF
jgi:hypothetical protein